MFANRGVHWGWHVVVLHLLCPVVCCRYLERGTHLPGELLIILVVEDLHQLFPPGWSLDVLGTPLYPFGCMQGKGSGSSGGVVVVMASVVKVEEGCLLHQCLPAWALPGPGVTGDGAQVAAST